MLSPELKQFISQHLTDQTDKLLLGAPRYPGIDVPVAVGQISIRKQIKEKLPDWYVNPDLFFPSGIAAEQCSSSATALYKQSLLHGDKVCDLTGGLGVDTYYFSQKAKEVTYVERFPEYCEAAGNNFKALQANNIRIINGDAREIAATLEADTFYIDPARRDGCNKRLFALTDCEPDVTQLKTQLLSKARRLLIKVSPMADISETLRILPETKEVHIVAVKNECKEILFALEPGTTGAEPAIFTVNYTSNGTIQTFTFRTGEEKEAHLHLASGVKKYLYEPNAALLKGGAFKLAAVRFGLEKLHQHSHLYTSDLLVEDFPGRRFLVENSEPFSGKLLKQTGKQIGQANITTRNFPLSVAEIRKRSSIKEGGTDYLFATTLANGEKTIIRCTK